MKILVITYYYPPDLSACSFRIESLIKSFKKLNESNCQKVIVDIVTTLPHRYTTYHPKISSTSETNSEIKEIRYNCLLNDSNLFIQIFSFIRFSLYVLKFTKNKKYDGLFVTSSRLFSATLGAYIARKNKIPLYIDIRDILCDTVKSMNNPYYLIALPLLQKIENYTYVQANKINLVSKGFDDYFNKFNFSNKLQYFTNGIDKDFIKNKKPYSRFDHIKILYAGNIGEGQALHKIIPRLAMIMPSNYIIKIIGDGNYKNLLLKELNNNNIKNVLLSDPLSRNDLIEEYNTADILFLHLNDYEAYKKVLPSKIFEYAASGLPILAGLSGYSANFMQNEILNSYVFPPCDVEAAINALLNIKNMYTNRDDFIKKYLRENIMNEFAMDILSTFKSERSYKSQFT